MRNMLQLGFYFDSSTCSGCKACQVACKDKNNLPAGILWRRVYEVTGGGWTRRGRAWTSDVFSYNISVACNHCQDAICVEACPASAIVKRTDGIVLVDRERCLGCRYCNWACPYDAPQYDAVTGRMSKCDLCADNVDAGLLPACVAGCPLRAMDFGELADLEARYGPGHNLFPLPGPDLTRPAIVVKSHRAAKQSSLVAARVANREEVQHGRQMTEGPLIVFTLLAQMAVGAFWLLRAFAGTASNTGIWMALCGVMAIALTSSCLHLGTWRNAWRATSNLRSSWLSREILFSLLFLGALLLFAGMPLQAGTYSTTREVIGWGAALCGLALIFSMTNVYRLRTVPAWDTWATTVSFFATTLFLGALGSAELLVLSPNLGQMRAQIQVLSAIAPLLVTIQFLLAKWWKVNLSLFRLRLFLLGMSLVAIVLMLWDVSWLGMSAGAAFVLAFAAEASGRYLFYQSRRGSLD